MTSRSRAAESRTRRVPRTLVAGGAALVLGGASQMAGNAPAEATHAGLANSGILNTTNWRIYETLPWPPGSLPVTGVAWGTAVWDAHPELSVVRTFTNSNIFYHAAPSPETWFGNTTCPGGLDARRNCAAKSVQMNNRTLDAAADPTTQWKKTACHEFGHVGGLQHQFTNNSCLTQGAAPPIIPLPDAHDNAAIADTYPR
jgi:hypothetical protein